MATSPELLEREWQTQSESNPFAEALQDTAPSGATPGAAGMEAWAGEFTPFQEWHGEALEESDADRLVEEAYAELRDEAFDEALAFLAEETEQAVADRFVGETAANADERGRYADAQLAPVRFEAVQYLDALEAGVDGTQLEFLDEARLDELLERFDPHPGGLTPAGEEFIGALVRKAKKAVKFVAKAAKKVGSAVGTVAGAVLGPVLKRLKALVMPLLRRVLSFAIGRLPAALQPVARTLAAKLTGEAEAFDGAVSGENLTDVEALAESFDAALAQALVAPSEAEQDFESGDGEVTYESREFERLAEARGVLIDRMRAAGDEEDLAPAIEQFIPALLGALRVGIHLVGRPKVVGFLARYLGQAIRRWVGPRLAGPLSNAIVDTGLRLVSLESPDEREDALAHDGEAAPVALASVVEDAVRRFAEHEEFVFEDEALMQLATAEAFGGAVATHFPARFVRPALQQAPSLGGTFVARQPRSVRTYRKYSRTPEIELTSQMADALPTFGGATVGAALRAGGVTLPMRARVHVYQAAPGTTLSRLVRLDRAPAGGRGHVPITSVHPLTPQAAGLLLKEPRLGAAIAPPALRSRQRIAPGQRFYVLQPLGVAAALPSSATRTAQARSAPSRRWMRIDPRRGHIVIGLYFSEADAHVAVTAMRKGQGHAVLAQALAAAYRLRPGAPALQREDEGDEAEAQEFEDLAPAARRRLPSGFLLALRDRLRRWVLPALAAWARENGEAFARAAAHPDAGVTVRVRVSAVPGFDALRQAMLAPRGGAVSAVPVSVPHGTPSIAIDVKPGRQRA